MRKILKGRRSACKVFIKRADRCLAYIQHWCPLCKEMQHINYGNMEC